MIGYHVTTEKKLARYRATGGILPPVRFWGTEYSAEKWAKKTGRSIIMTIRTTRAYPLPIKGGAYWTDEIVRMNE